MSNLSSPSSSSESPIRAGWEPPIISFNPLHLPILPPIQDFDLVTVIASLGLSNYDVPISPSEQSVQSLAFLGDSIVGAAACQALFTAMTEAHRVQRLAVSRSTRPLLPAAEAIQSIRNTLVRNVTHSYLSLHYGIPHLCVNLPQDLNQKRAADLFEAYVGAAWLSASRRD